MGQIIWIMFKISPVKMGKFHILGFSFLKMNGIGNLKEFIYIYFMNLWGFFFSLTSNFVSYAKTHTYYWNQELVLCIFLWLCPPGQNK